MTEGFEADKFGGWKGEHEEQREAVRLMTAVHNKNNRLSSSDQDPPLNFREKTSKF